MSFSVINEGYISLRDKGKFIFDFTFFDNGKTILILTRPGDRRITYIGKSQMIVTGIE